MKIIGRIAGFIGFCSCLGVLIVTVVRSGRANGAVLWCCSISQRSTKQRDRCDGSIDVTDGEVAIVGQNVARIWPSRKPSEYVASRISVRNRMGRLTDPPNLVVLVDAVVHTDALWLSWIKSVVHRAALERLIMKLLGRDAVLATHRRGKFRKVGEQTVVAVVDDARVGENTVRIEDREMIRGWKVTTLLGGCTGHPVVLLLQNSGHGRSCGLWS